MYIMSCRGKEIVNSDFVERFRIDEKDDCDLIIASYSASARPVTMARYPKETKEAQAALNDLFMALTGGQQSFYMPESTLYDRERIIKDARTKRRGGS